MRRRLPPEKCHGCRSGIASGLNADAVADQVGPASVVAVARTDEGVAKKPEHPALTQIHAVGIISPQPPWVLPKEAIGRRPCTGPEMNGSRRLSNWPLAGHGTTHQQYREKQNASPATHDLYLYHKATHDQLEGTAVGVSIHKP